MSSIKDKFQSNNCSASIKASADRERRVEDDRITTMFRLLYINGVGKLKRYEVHTALGQYSEEICGKISAESSLT